MADTDEFNDIPEVASNPQALRNATEELVGYGDGDVGGHIQVEEEFNLNAAAIGLGLENIEYEPEKFPGLIYRHADPDATAVLFSDGQMTVVDAWDEEEARDIIVGTIERMRELELYDGEAPDEQEVTVAKTQ